MNNGLLQHELNYILQQSFFMLSLNKKQMEQNVYGP